MIFYVWCNEHGIVGFTSGISVTTIERINLQNKTRTISWRVYRLGLAVTGNRTVFMFFAWLKKFLNTKKFFQRNFSCIIDDISYWVTEGNAGMLLCRLWQVWVMRNQVGNCSFSSLLFSVYFSLLSKWCLIVPNSNSTASYDGKLNTHINKQQAITVLFSTPNPYCTRIVATNKSDIFRCREFCLDVINVQ